MKHCAPCHLDVPDTSTFCRQCGGALVEQATVKESVPHCSRCGARVQANWQSCPQCGNLLRTAAATVKMSDSTHCLNCDAPLREGMKFCVACGAPASSAQESRLSKTVIEDLPDAHPNLAKTVIEDPRDTDPRETVSETRAIGQPGDFPCRYCGALIRAGHTFCETCGATISARRQTSSFAQHRKTILIASSVAAGLLVLLLGWFFWGVSVTVVATPADAQVMLDDKTAGGSGTTFSHVRRGNHTLRVKRDGFEDSLMPINIGIGDFSKTVEVRLVPLRYALILTATPKGCRVLLDGKEVGVMDDTNGKLTLSEVTRGNHTLTIQHSGYQDWTKSVSVTTAQTITADLALDVSGAWRGSFEAAPSQVSFTFNLKQTGDSFTGSADQLDNNNKESHATLDGKLSGKEIKFTKRYPSGTVVDFSGTINEDGKRVTGRWTYATTSGAWAMSKPERADSDWLAPPTLRVDKLNATVTGLKFYESSGDDSKEKTYRTRFESAATHYINYELSLRLAAQGRRVDFPLTAVWYRAEGTELTRQSREARVEGDWTTSMHYAGWGSTGLGTWSRGYYRLDLFVAGKKVASDWFEVY